MSATQLPGFHRATTRSSLSSSFHESNEEEEELCPRSKPVRSVEIFERWLVNVVPVVEYYKNINPFNSGSQSFTVREVTIFVICV